MRWQKWQVMPSKSLSVSSILPSRLQPSTLPPGGSERPASQPVGAWQRRQKSPTPGRSLFATSSAAQKSGSRPALAIIEPAQVGHGSWWVDDSKSP